MKFKQFKLMSNSAKKALLFNNLEGLLSSDFQRELLKASLDNLFDHSNKLRFNNFAFSMRELSRHILHSRAPDSDVMSCTWYVEPKEKGQAKITRKQRIQYIIYGGLNPDFVDRMDLEILSVYLIF
ncbi:hypothetical protein LZG74_17730 [Dyadobacter sp. CY327]|uniref:pPIWI-associating nuclease domain-containing protein n=1 Tax=Dyadobacter sp. CY327 TaxID=2907301 RepID=UPI001F2BCD36|nr:hypothetical protein [Dyadobacter sp. CY327]MCE7072162.1 hypothetical protein [Dyadobacter sp. CY327]